MGKSSTGAARHRVEKQPLMSMEETAAYLGRSVEALRMMVRRGKVPGVVKIDRRIQFNRQAIYAWVESKAR